LLIHWRRGEQHNVLATSAAEFFYNTLKMGPVFSTGTN
jgi:hypothetical protein